MVLLLPNDTLFLLVFNTMHSQPPELCTSKEHDSYIPQRDNVSPSLSTLSSFEANAHHCPLS